MNSRQRIFATLSGEPVDRRPFSVLMSLYGAGLTGCPLRQYYTDPAAYARGQAAAREVFHPDVLFSPFNLAGEAEAFGGEVRYFDDQPPNLERPGVSSPEQLGPDRMPDFDSHPRLVYTREALRAIARAHGAEAPIAGIVLSPIDLPIMILGLEKWLETVLFDEAGVRRTLDLTIPYFLEWTRVLLAEGADVLAMPLAFLTPSVATRQIVEKIAVPILRDAFSRIGAPILVHHTGAPFLAYADLYRDLPNVVGFVMDHRDDLREARARLGSDIALVGGLDATGVGTMSAQAIEADCRRLLQNRCADSRFVVGTSGPDIALTTPAENIHAIRRAVESFGGGAGHG